MRTNVRHQIRPVTGHSGLRSAKRRVCLRVESLEVRDVPSATLALDFNTMMSATAKGYTGVKPVLYSTVNHLGWESLDGIRAGNRLAGNALDRDVQTGTDGTFLADVPNGTYDLVLGVGDVAALRDKVSVAAEGQPLASDLTTLLGQVLEVRGRVTIADGQLTLHIFDGGGKNARFAIDYLTLTAADPNATGLMPAAITAPLPGFLSAKGAELGVRFTADTDGFISGIRFYKRTANTGIHTGSLWSADGTRLATATFTGETTSGWQEVRFATPVAIQANTTYVASYYSPKGRYSLNRNYFAAAGLTSGQLTIQSTADGGGGVYAKTDTFPTTTNRNSNYWVDVVYARETTPPTVTTVTPANNAINVSTSSPVTVTFSEGMTATTVNASTVLLKTSGGATLSATVSYDPATLPQL